MLLGREVGEGVKRQLVVYPDKAHGFRDPAHIKTSLVGVKSKAP